MRKLRKFELERVYGAAHVGVNSHDSDACHENAEGEVGTLDSDKGGPANEAYDGQDGRQWCEDNNHEIIPYVD